MRYGYKLSAEGFGPKELVRQAKLAEASGFDFVDISDHYHPWLDSQGHSPFAWTVACTRMSPGSTALSCGTVITPLWISTATTRSRTVPLR